MLLQVFEQPGQPGGTEQTRQSVPDAAVLAVRHRVGHRDRHNPSSMSPLPAHHLLQGYAGRVCHGGCIFG